MSNSYQSLNIDASITVGFWSTELVKEDTLVSIRQQIKSSILKQIQNGKTNFIVTVANEFQILASEILLKLKTLYPQIRLFVITPYRFGYFSTLLLDLNLIERAKFICQNADVYYSVCDKVEQQWISRIKIFNNHLESYVHLCSVLILYSNDNSFYEPKKIKKLRDHLNIVQIVDSNLSKVNEWKTFELPMTTEINFRKKLRQFCDLIGKRKKAAFILANNGWTGNVIHHDIWMQAYRIALEIEICASVQEGILDYIITLENELQVIAGEAVFKIKQFIPAIRCIVLLPCRENAFCGNNWNENLRKRAEKLYNQAEIKEYFCQHDNSSVLKGFHHFLYTLCSKVIYYIRMNHNSTPYHIVCWLGIPKRDMLPSITEALDLTVCDILIDSFVDYCMETTNSRLICQLTKTYLQKFNQYTLYERLCKLYYFPSIPSINQSTVLNDR